MKFTKLKKLHPKSTKWCQRAVVVMFDNGLDDLSSVNENALYVYEVCRIKSNRVILNKILKSPKYLKRIRHLQSIRIFMKYFTKYSKIVTSPNFDSSKLKRKGMMARCK